MNYIVVDFEWNQPKTEQQPVCEPIFADSEIIEFGAVKLNDHFEAVGEFCRFVKPVFYPILNGRVARLTQISGQDVQEAQGFAEVFADFCDWCGEEYALMTWGPTDIPVLMENMIAHGISASQMPVCYDLQRIFGREIMRNDEQCSLEKAVATLNLPADRAHDALNDARNTAQICSFLDLEAYMKEYLLSYVDYGQMKMDHAVPTDEERTEQGSFRCPYCGELIAPCKPWVFDHTASAYAACPEGDEFLVVLDRSRIDDDHYVIKRVVVEMNDDIWDRYADRFQGEF